MAKFDRPIRKNQKAEPANVIPRKRQAVESVAKMAAFFLMVFLYFNIVINPFILSYLKMYTFYVILLSKVVKVWPIAL